MIRRLIRLYTPFICTFMCLLNGVSIFLGYDSIPQIYIMANLTGNSVLLDVYMLCCSRKMCVWYKADVCCLLLIQICGLLYNAFDIDEALYLFCVILLSAIGMITFFIFRVFYVVTHEFVSSRRRSRA